MNKVEELDYEEREHYGAIYPDATIQEGQHFLPSHAWPGGYPMVYYPYVRSNFQQHMQTAPYYGATCGDCANKPDVFLTLKDYCANYETANLKCCLCGNYIEAAYLDEDESDFDLDEEDDEEDDE